MSQYKELSLSPQAPRPLAEGPDLKGNQPYVIPAVQQMKMKRKVIIFLLWLDSPDRADVFKQMEQ